MKRVLVIDDDELYRETVAACLEQAGYSVRRAENGTRGVELAQSNPFDLIISDVIMDDLDGFAVLDRLRMDPSTSSIPFILMTGLSDKENMRRGMSRGADDFIVKPFTAVDLLSAVEARLEKQREMNDAAERKLNELRANISLALPHELRTPLTAILGYSELLADEHHALDREEVAHIGRSILRGGLNLRRIIENFLIYAQIEVIASDSKKVEALRRSRLSNASRLVGALARGKAASYDRIADVEVALSDAPVAVSEEYLTRIVEELLDNAFKFSKAGTPVHVSVSTVGNEFALSVKDQGRGMSPVQVASLGAYMQFERKFYEQKGTGLGLSIAKRLTELHGGRMEFDLDGGPGTTVLVYLPA